MLQVFFDTRTTLIIDHNTGDKRTEIDSKYELDNTGSTTPYARVLTKGNLQYCDSSSLTNI